MTNDHRMDDFIKSKFEIRIKKQELVDLTNSSINHFNEVVKIALSEEQPMAWRAAWILNSSIKKNDVRLINQIPKIINFLDGRDDGHLRELLKLLDKMTIPDEEEGKLFDICISTWEILGKSPSVRITAFKLLVKIAKKYPELAEELSFLTHSDYIEPLSPGIKNSVLKLKKELSFMMDSSPS